jgi:hypothetical protein
MIAIRSPGLTAESKPPGTAPAAGAISMIIAYATLRGRSNKV